MGLNHDSNTKTSTFTQQPRLLKDRLTPLCFISSSSLYSSQIMLILLIQKGRNAEISVSATQNDVTC